jgi:hypothetical protein
MIEYTYTAIIQRTVYTLFNPFTPCQLCINVSNLGLRDRPIALGYFPDDNRLWIEACRDVQCDIRI